MKDFWDDPLVRLVIAHEERKAALAAAARQGGDVKQAPGEAPQSGPNESEGNAQRKSA